MGWLFSHLFIFFRSSHFTVLVFIPLFGCNLATLEGSRKDSRVFENMVNVPGGLTPEEILRASAFRLLRGLPRDDAQDYLVSDGFECANYMCSKVIVEQELLPIGLRPPGPLRTFRREWTLSIRSEVVEVLDDLATTFDVTVLPPY